MNAYKLNIKIYKFKKIKPLLDKKQDIVNILITIKKFKLIALIPRRKKLMRLSLNN